MPNVVFVAPFVMEATLRFLDAAAAVPGARVAVVSQQPAAAIPESVRGRLVGHFQVADAFDAGEVVRGVRGLEQHLGPVSRVIGMLEQLQVPLATAREALGIGGLAPLAAHRFRDKSAMKTHLRASGLPCAAHCLVTQPEQALDFAGRVGYPMVVKPPDGAGAKATFRVDGPEQLQSALRLYRPGPGRAMLLEEFLSGEEATFDCVFVGGRAVWHSIATYRPTPLEVLENPWIQWAVLLPREISGPAFGPIRDLGPKAIAALGLQTGVAHLEWFRRPDGSIAISEVGARPPGAQICSLISYAHDIDFYRAWAMLMIHDHFEPPERRYAVGAAYFRGQGTGRVVGIEGIEQAQREMGEIVVEARLPRPGQGKSSSYEGEGWAILRHPDTEVVERSLRRLVQLVQVKMGPA